MNDILPPKRPLSRSVPPQPVVTPPPVTPIEMPSETPPLKPKGKRHVVRWVVMGILGAIILMGAGLALWYELSLRPVNAQDTSRTRVIVGEGMTPSAIGKLLQDNKLIRSQYVFDIYTKLTNTRSKLQAGSYRISPSESMQTIVNDLVAGKIDEFSLTFLPGATVQEDKDALVKSGYKKADVDAAFSKTYDHPLFATKPAGADLEGYIYGETYKFNGDASLEKILTTTFDEYYRVIKENNLIDGFKRQGLTLYQGLTLASIVQREVPNSDDQRQVAQIFLRRLAMDMPLGSDVTYHYAADKLGVDPSPSLESPYNTRIHKGLPPGPIATPGLSALKAVANPASGDYLYFLSGDDDKTYYAKTDQEHQANIDMHCKIKCSTP
jgi:UPF0755 protein